MRERELLRWKKNDLGEKLETSSFDTNARVCTKATSDRSTGAKNASKHGDLRLLRDEKMAAVAIQRSNNFLFSTQRDRGKEKDRKKNPEIRDLKKPILFEPNKCSMKAQKLENEKTMKQSYSPWLLL